MFDELLPLLVAAQTRINQSVGATITAFAASHDWGLLAAILPIGTAFGAIHALTPGHSKMVLASYVAGSPLSLARGLGVAALLSFTHISSAVLIALLALPIVAVSFTGAGRAPLLEDISRAMIALIGAWMLLQAWRGGRHRHQDAPLFGAMAGLIPCPLTLFAMVLAVGRGAWEAGVMFAAAFFLGVTLTLSCVALTAFAARSNLGRLVDRFGGSMDRFGRTIEAGAGAILIVIGLQELILR